jgi:hypothetical protein
MSRSPRPSSPTRGASSRGPVQRSLRHAGPTRSRNPCPPVAGEAPRNGPGPAASAKGTRDSDGPVAENRGRVALKKDPAAEHPSYGYRRISVLLRRAGSPSNGKAGVLDPEGGGLLLGLGLDCPMDLDAALPLLPHPPTVGHLDRGLGPSLHSSEDLHYVSRVYLFARRVPSSEEPLQHLRISQAT